MVIVNVRDRKFVVRFSYGPAGVSKYSLRKAVKLLELDFINGDFSFNRAMNILDGAKTVERQRGIEKYSRRKTTCVIEEEIGDAREMNEVAAVSAVNDSQEPFTKNYGRTLAYKKAVLTTIKNAALEDSDIIYFETAWKEQMPKSAETWDSIDTDAVAKSLHEAVV